MRAGFFLAAALLAASPVFSAPLDEWADEDKDGRKETHFFYEDSKIVRAEADSSGDGKIDRWVKYADGKRYTAENDRDQDGRMDRWDFYTSEGLIGRTGKDTDADGKPDTFTTLLNGRQIVMKEQDRNGDGKIDRRRFCEWTILKRTGTPSVPGHKALWTEEDNDFDGKIDKYIDKKNKFTEKGKIGKPMDGRLTPFPGTPSTPAAAPAGTPAEGAVSGPSKGAKKPAEKRHVDLMNARHGLEAIDWDQQDKNERDQ